MNNLQSLIEKITSVLSKEQLGMYSDEILLKASLEDEVYNRLPEYMEKNDLETFAQANQTGQFPEQSLETLPFYQELLERVCTDFIFAAVTAE